MDHDKRVHLLKKYRTQFASAPAVTLSVLAGVSFHMSCEEAFIDVVVSHPLKTLRHGCNRKSPVLKRLLLRLTV